MQKKPLLDKLHKLEKSLEEEIKEAKTQSQPVQLDQQSVGRVSRIDAIQQQQMHLASLRRLEQRFQLVKSAINRFHSDSFGLCTKCEEPIESERLMAMPETLLCLSCAT